MAKQGRAVLVLLAVLAAPTSAARSSGSDAELNLEGQIATLDENLSNAAGQEDAQVQSKSLAGTPSTDQIRLSSASASFGATAYGALSAGAAVTSFQSIGGTIIMKGVSIWVNHQKLEMIYGMACNEYVKLKAWGPNGKSGQSFSVILNRVWDEVVVPSLRRAEESGDRKEMKELVDLAQNFLLYTETFLAVGAYLRVHEDQCPTYLREIQWSWNSMQDAYELANNGYYYKRVFQVFNEDGSLSMQDQPTKTDRPKSMSGMKSEMETGTDWSLLRWTSALDRILNVAKKLKLYNERGELTAPECRDAEPQLTQVVRSTNHIQDEDAAAASDEAWRSKASAFWNGA